MSALNHVDDAVGCDGLSLNDSSSSELLDNALGALASCGYECFTGPLMSEDYPRTSSPQPSLQVGNLVWVLKSKGRRRKNGTHPPPSMTATEETTKDASHTQRTPPVSSQRFELFCRARIIANPNKAGLQQEVPTAMLTPNARVEPPDTQTPTAATSTTPPPPRVWIQYPKGSTYHVKRDRLCRVMERERGVILVWPETDVYRRSCLTHTLPAGEAFVEIGCDHGPTVNRIASWMTDPSLALGIDKARDSIVSARQRYPQYTFVKWDCLDAAASQADQLPAELQDVIQRSQSFHLAIDINGNRELTAVLACLRRLLRDFALRPRLVFVKSRAMFQELTAREKVKQGLP